MRRNRAEVASSGLSVREGGLEAAIAAAGGVGALARALGISQPAVSSWQRVPAERVIAVESLTGVPRNELRPDLYPIDPGPIEVDEVDQLRSQIYTLLASLLRRAPGREMLTKVAEVRGDATPFGLAAIALADAARRADPDAVSREFFDLFIGVGRGEILPYASYYLTGFLHERPLARVREDLAVLGLERAEGEVEPEDHVALLCEVMAGLATRAFEAEPGAERRFFERHLKPWAGRLFADLETCRRAEFYRAVAALGRLFIEIEAEGFAMDA
jgi:TorA maturation chaperone TorD